MLKLILTEQSLDKYFIRHICIYKQIHMLLLVHVCKVVKLEFPPQQGACHQGRQHIICRNTPVTPMTRHHPGMDHNGHWHYAISWGRVTHLCVSKLSIIGSNNGLAPGRRQAIIWTNAGILWIEPLGKSYRSFKKMHLKMSSMKLTAILSRPQCNMPLRGMTLAADPQNHYTVQPDEFS